MATEEIWPEAPTARTIITDLEISNEHGGGWFLYRPYPQDDGAILVDLFNEDGNIEKTFLAHVSIEEVAA